MSIGKLAGSPEAGRYYTDAVAKGREDYYQGGGEAPGAWHGHGAQQLGLGGRVEDEPFAAVLAGKRPDGCGVLRSSTGPSRLAGFDLTFSAPKSVSILFGVSEPAVAAAVREAHDEAVRQALGYIEREATFTRRGTNGRQVLRGGGLVVAAFRHRTSRAGDPQLHTHAVVANTTFADGRWSTLDGRAILAHTRTAGFLYQAALREGLTRDLDVQFADVVHGVADLAGVSREVIEHFSRRRLEIEERMAERGDQGPKAADAAALDTRKRKNYDVPVDRLREDWRARASEHGLDSEQVRDLLDRPPLGRRPNLRIAAQQLSGPAGLTRASSSFDRRDVIRAWCEQHPAGAPVERIEQLTDRWLTSPHAIQLEDPDHRSIRGPRFSTPSMLDSERRLIDTAKERLRQQVAVADRSTTERVLNERPELSSEQRTLVNALTSSGDGVQIVRAAAGTGKTYALEAAHQAWRSSGLEVRGCALSARAALELHEQTAIPSDTISRILGELHDGWAPHPTDVLIVDEAGMAGTRALERLATHAAQENMKLVLVGDDRQLPEIDAGGALHGLAKRIGALELRDVRRQHHEWDREALSALRHGKIADWANAYREHERIHTQPTPGKVRSKLVEDWWQHARTGADAVMVAHRRSDVRDLNQRARERMHQDGKLTGPPLTTADRAFAVGDRVLARRNDRDLQVTNGTRGLITSIDHEDRAVTLTPEQGDPITVDGAYLDAGHLDHAYATTAHALQGASVDHAFILGTSDLYREWGYTALTRHRQEAHYYLRSDTSADPQLPGLERNPDILTDELRATLGRPRRKTLAIDLDRRASNLRQRGTERTPIPPRAKPARSRRRPRDLATLLRDLQDLQPGRDERGPDLGP